MRWTVRVRYRKGVKDPVAVRIKREIADLKIEGVRDVEAIPTYIVSGNINEKEIKRL